MIGSHSLVSLNTHASLRSPLIAIQEFNSTMLLSAMNEEKITDSNENTYNHQVSLGPESESSGKPINSPLVLQCRHCRTIIGDTCSVVDLNPEMRTITLEKKSENTVIGEELHTSLDTLDYGSTFHIISCRHCETALGRMYRTTSRELDLWRGQYTYSSEVLSFYELSAAMNVMTSNITEIIREEDVTVKSSPSQHPLEISKRVEKLEKRLDDFKSR